MELQRQHAGAGDDRGEDYRRIARELLPGTYFQAIGHGGYVFRGARGQAAARSEAIQAHGQPPTGTAATSAHALDADAAFPRRWWALLHGARLRQVHADDPERRPPWFGKNPQCELSQDDR